MISKDDIIKALNETSKSASICGIQIDGAKVQITLEVSPKSSPSKRQQIERQATKEALKIDAIKSATIIMTAHISTVVKGISAVKHTIAISSGKGGVGKSTIAVNIAASLDKMGFKVGILDADVSGASIPKMLGINAKPDSSSGKYLLPLMRGNIVAMSIGFLVEAGKPIIWRGPMIMGAIKQLLGDVVWGQLDVLIVDMPPGTSDAQITLAQTVDLSGAVIVSTPQDIALIDALKGIKMFQKVKVPILGVVENMSTFVCPSCGVETEIFDCGGAGRMAKELNIEKLGSIPLHISIRKACDEGMPIVEKSPNSPQALEFMGIAKKIAKKLKL